MNTQAKPTWSELLRRVAYGGEIRGDELLRLPLFDDALPIAGELRPVTESLLIYAAARIAARVDDRLNEDAMVGLAAELHSALRGSAEGGPAIEEEHRFFAWQLGAAADFAAGLDGVGLLPNLRT